jgi:hypothetical protein
VRKLDGELPFVFWFHGLVCPVWFAESKARIFAGRRALVTDGANRRAGSSHRLPREELLSMTTHAGGVIRKVSYVRKISLRAPGCGNFVAVIAGEAFVLRR